jgi:hypothetical protein
LHDVGRRFAVGQLTVVLPALLPYMTAFRHWTAAAHG